MGKQFRAMENNRKNTVEISTIESGQRPNANINVPMLNRVTQLQKINLIYSFRPVYYFARFFGLLPFKVICDSKGIPIEARVGAFDLIWLVITVCLYLFMATVCYFYYPHDKNDFYVLRMGDRFLIITTLVNGAVACALDMFNRAKVVTTLRDSTRFDMEVCDYLLMEMHLCCH